MPDSRFYLTGRPIAIEDAVRIAGAKLVRPGARLVARAAAACETDISSAVIFAEAAEQALELQGRAVGLCLIGDGLDCDFDGALARHKNPRLGFARLAARLHRDRPFGEDAGVHPTAQIGAQARLHRTAVIAEGARIGEEATIGPFAFIGPGVEIGPGADIGAAVTITHALIGARFTALPGARIGQAGFGFAEGPEGLFPVPQLGRVLVGDDVVIGANSTVDRGALGDTSIGDGVKIDNLVHIGHNVRIGRGSVLVAQVGIAGSTVVGERAMLGGQVGLADHLSVGDGAQVAAQSGVMRDIPPGEKWGGSPARPTRQWFRETAALARLAAQKRAPRDDED